MRFQKLMEGKNHHLVIFLGGGGTMFRGGRWRHVGPPKKIGGSWGCIKVGYRFLGGCGIGGGSIPKKVLNDSQMAKKNNE